MAWMAKTEEPLTQLATRIPKELHRRLKLYCVTHEIDVQDLGFPGFRRHSEPHEKCDRSESWGRSGGGDRSRRSSRRKRSGWCGRVARASARWRVSSI